MAAPHDSVIRPNRLLLATDGSEDAVLAARVATGLSLRTGARLHVAEEGEGRKTLLAVGCRGLGAMGRARLGSVSTNVLRAARGPVLIYSKSAGESMGRTSEC